MKRLIAALLMFITLTASAEPFKLGFDRTQSGDMYVIYDEKLWEKVGSQDDWTMYIARGEISEINGLIIMHTMIVYHNEVKNTFNDEMIKKIFNVGLVECKGEQIFLMTDFFTDKDHKVIWISKYEFGEFISDVAPGTARNKVYNILCGGKHI